ncbi:hypothetical protein BP6252_06066 [Coleophoma cylindrospora]|uniref:Uncharacterized protein n=1 Tax=Coleophoma cylindrospora TaxID=1849047 RepID=A0A3D8RM04_9HELO|nr:hypothetical protein BP6252_06066 [Coleophoma cylindrospora]
MLLKTLASLLAVVGVSAIPHDKRSIATDMTIYAYGTGISGLPVRANSNGDIDTKGESAWNVTSNTTTTSSTFYIVTTTDAFAPAGFLSANATASTGVETLGFALYGSSVAFISDSTYLSQFWATKVSDDEYTINWNVNGSDHANSIPVNLKITAPTLPSS